MIAAKHILQKITAVCSSKQEEHVEVLYCSLKMYLYALNAYTAGVGSEAKQIITEQVTDLQVCLLQWVQSSDIGFGDRFGGKNGSKIKDEIKVSTVENLCSYILNNYSSCIYNTLLF